MRQHLVVPFEMARVLADEQVLVPLEPLHQVAGTDALAALVIAIANINVWNRLNIATRQIAGAWKP